MSEDERRAVMAGLDARMRKAFLADLAERGDETG